MYPKYVCLLIRQWQQVNTLHEYGNNGNSCSHFFSPRFSIMLGADIGHMQTFGAYISKTLDPAVNAVCH